MATTTTPKPEAAKPQANAPAKGKQVVETIQLEHPELTIQMVKFSDIFVLPDEYAFRGRSLDKPFSKSALHSLKERIKSAGQITDPLLLKDYAGGKKLMADGHRRYYSLKQLIEEGVEGFTADMLVPAHVLHAKTSKLVMIATALASNIERETLPYEGRLDATLSLHQLGMPVRQIADLLHVGETTVTRDLLLAKDDNMRDYVRRHVITASNAVTLLAVAEDAGKQKLLAEILSEWQLKTLDQLLAENKARVERDEKPLRGSKVWLQNRMSPELIASWKDALEQGTPTAVPKFRFKALVRTDAGPARIEVDGLSKNVEDLASADVGKVIERCIDLAKELEPIFTAKLAKEKQGAAAKEEGGLTPGRKRLLELGFSELAGGAEEPDDGDDDNDDTGNDAGGGDSGDGSGGDADNGDAVTAMPTTVMTLAKLNPRRKPKPSNS